jgi:hypothetical protein
MIEKNDCIEYLKESKHAKSHRLEYYQVAKINAVLLES